MKGAELGAKWLLSCGSISQAVVPATGLPSASVQSKAAPPQAWTSIPRCRLYQACRAGASLALKKMPPMPVTRFMEPPRSGGAGGACDGTPISPGAQPDASLRPFQATLGGGSRTALRTTPRSLDAVDRSDSGEPEAQRGDR